MSKSFHMSQSIEGPLMNWSKKDWRRATGYMTKDGGKKFTADELKAEFLRMHGEGILYIPLGECDNFDPKEGCKGHEAK
jgi:hypothetical protein